MQSARDGANSNATTTGGTTDAVITSVPQTQTDIPDAIVAQGDAFASTVAEAEAKTQA